MQPSSFHCLSLKGRQSVPWSRGTTCMLDAWWMDVCVSCHNTGLQELHLDDNNKVTDVSMPTVGQLMQQLTYLDLRHTRITQVGLEWLQQLPRLTKVYTCKCNVTNPKIQQWSAWSNDCYRWQCRNP